VDVAAARWLGVDFPYGTMIVNVVGSFLIGVVQEAALSTPLVPESLRLVLAVGVLGGFTTYSAFSYGTIRLAERGTAAAAVNVVLTTGLCLGACALGLLLTRALVAPR
jgi:CrcB protein